MVVSTHDGVFHLFQYDDVLPEVPAARWLLANVEGIPSVFGPKAGCDNIIGRVLYNGRTKRLMCQIQGYRAATETLEEVTADLHANGGNWKYITQIAKEDIRDLGPQDMLDADDGA
jgi:hypothetical protein